MPLRPLVAAFLCVALSVGASAQTAGAGSAGAPADAGHGLRLLAPFDSAEAAAWQKLLDAYAHETGTQVTLMVPGGIDRASYDAAVAAALNTESPPDLVMLGSATTAAREIAQGLLAPASDQAAGAMLPFAMDAAARDGHLYGTPLQLRGLGFWYSRDVFAKFSLAPPKTYDELAALCRTLRRQGIACLTLGGKDPAVLSHLFDWMVETTCGPALHDRLLHYEAHWDEVCVVSAYDRLRQWVDDQWLKPDFANTTTAEARVALYQGEVGMILDDSTLEGAIKRDELPVDRFGTLPPPTDQTPLRVAASITQLAVPAASAHKAAAAAFVQFLAQPATAQRFPALFLASALRDGAPDCTAWPQSCAWRAITADRQRLFAPTEQVLPRDLVDSLLEVQGQMLSGELTPEGAAGLFTSRVDAWHATHPASAL